MGSRWSGEGWRLELDDMVEGERGRRASAVRSRPDLINFF